MMEEALLVLWMDGKKKTKEPRACEVGARALGR